MKRLRSVGGEPHRQLQYQRVVDFVNTVLQGIQPVTEMKAGYTGVDIDLHRIHSRDDMDKCKIYSAVDRGVVRGYTAGKSVTNWGSGASRRRILVD